MHIHRIPIYRTYDHELLGFVESHDREWHVYTVFGSRVARYADQTAAQEYLHTHGLEILNHRWHYYESQTDTWQVVCIQEASPTYVQLVLGYYAMPSIPTKLISVADLANGDILQPEDPHLS